MEGAAVIGTTVEAVEMQLSLEVLNGNAGDFRKEEGRKREAGRR